MGNVSFSFVVSSCSNQLDAQHKLTLNAFLAGTTWREMAEDVLDKVLGDDHPKCNTLDIVLHGGEGYEDTLGIQLIQKYGLMEDVAEVSEEKEIQLLLLTKFSFF